jgi:hypothetical protein
VVERLLAKEKVTGSSPVARSIYHHMADDDELTSSLKPSHYLYMAT